MTTDAVGPLVGLKVLDASAVVAGPWASTQLADLGADVIFVERVDGADTMRLTGPVNGEQSGCWVAMHRNKRSLALNLRDAQAIEILKKLAAESDIFLQNFRPGVADRLGIGYDDLKAVNPDLIYISISGFGPTGPYANQPVYDPIVQGLSGAAFAQGGDFFKSIIVDKTTAMTTATAALAAVIARSNGAGGQHIQISLLESILAWLWPDVYWNHALPDSEPVPTYSIWYSPYNTADGQISAVWVSYKQFQSAARALGRPDLAEDERFASREGRLRHSLLMRAEFGAALKDLTTEQALAALRTADVPFGSRAGPRRRVRRPPGHPHRHHRGRAAPHSRPDRHHPPAGPLQRDADGHHPTRPRPRAALRGDLSDVGVRRGRHRRNAGSGHHHLSGLDSPAAATAWNDRSMGLRGDAAVVGWAEWESERRHAGPRAFQLEQWADLSALALADAGIAATEVNGLVCCDLRESTDFVPATIAEYCGWRVNFAERVDLGGASPVGMVWRAAAAIELGLCDVVVCAVPARPRPRPTNPRGPRQDWMTTGASSNEWGSPQAEFDIPYGNIAQNAGYAMIAQRYAAEFGWDERALAKIAADQRTSADANPLAVFKDVPLTIDDVLASKVVADPIHVLEIVMPCQGGSAIVVTSQRAGDLHQSSTCVHQRLRRAPGVQDPQLRRRPGPDPHRPRRRAGVRHGRPLPGRHRRLPALRLLHHHGAPLARGRGLLRQGRGTRVRPSARPQLPRRLPGQHPRRAARHGTTGYGRRNDPSRRSHSPDPGSGRRTPARERRHGVRLGNGRDHERAVRSDPAGGMRPMNTQPQPAPIVPDPTPTAQPFWDALAADRVDLQHCADCGQWVYYPRSRCSACMSRNLVWETISGEGTLYTFTIARQPTTPAFIEVHDLVLAVVELDEGPRLTTSLENVSEDRIRIGMRVKPYFHQAGDLTLLRYQPA